MQQFNAVDWNLIAERGVLLTRAAQGVFLSAVLFMGWLLVATGAMAARGDLVCEDQFDSGTSDFARAIAVGRELIFVAGSQLSLLVTGTGSFELLTRLRVPSAGRTDSTRRGVPMRLGLSL